MLLFSLALGAHHMHIQGIFLAKRPRHNNGYDRWPAYLKNTRHTPIAAITQIRSTSSIVDRV